MFIKRGIVIALSTFKTVHKLNKDDPYQRMLSGFLDTIQAEVEVNHYDVLQAIAGLIFNYHRICKVDIEEMTNDMLEQLDEHVQHFDDECDPSRN